VAESGRKPILDEIKKAQIIAILSVGCSRRTAAAFVGCAPGTVRNTADRDEDFAKQLREAENKHEFNYLKSIRKAATQEKYWRAAAWVLERKYPDQYGRRGPEVITLSQIKDLLARFAEIIAEEVPTDEHRRNILRRLEALSNDLKGASQ